MSFRSNTSLIRFFRVHAGLLALVVLLPCCSCHSRQKDDAPAKMKKDTTMTMTMTISEGDIRNPAVAGSWYSNNPAELRQQLQSYLDKVEPSQLDHIFGLVSPHAGYVYSGPVAAYAYKQILGKKYDAVVVIAPSHVEAFPFASVYGRGAYKTPLGILPVDTALAEEIARDGNLVRISDKGHRQEKLNRQEHSLEIQLPFLQIVLGDFKLVPIIMGDQRDEVVHQLAAALVEAVRGKNILLVASSDLSHFHPYTDANRIDSGLVKHVEEYDFEGLLKDLDYQKIEACGGGPICAVMEACKQLGANKSKVLKHANSGDVPQGERGQVVGYLAAAFYRDSNKPDAKGKADSNQSESDSKAKTLTSEEKRTLMNIAKTTVEAVVKGESVPKYEVTSPDLLENRGAFVTLHKRGELRGCIGYIVGIKPLYQTVREVAEAAALNDPRFDPVRPAELKELEYEISALSVPHPISNINEITVGIHGIIMRKGYNQGLLLPQVATEYGWDRETFLRQTCRKAGLPPEAWKDKETEIQIFSAEVFGEKDIK